jgi:hypothetical protein
VGFRRPLGQNEVGEWERLMEMLDLQTVRHNGANDSYRWLFKKSGIYSTRCTVICCLGEPITSGCVGF